MEIHAGDSESFKKMLKDKRPILMLYHMTLCPHCQILKPTWEKVKRKLKSGDGLQVVEVEYSNLSALPTSLRQIRGFPTIQMIEHGKVKQEYFGDRSMNSIVDFALSHSSKSEISKPKVATKKKKVAANKA
jgi:thiol-disulfide isomerase/thioredoxin